MNNLEIENPESNKQLTTISDRILALKAKAEQSVTLWDAAPGSTICGQLFSKRQVQTQYALQDQFILKDESGNLIAYWLSKFIEQQLRSQSANYGDLIAISSHGKAKTAAGKEYNSFSVLVDRVNG
ncbi:hypothetical protein ABXJ76_04185 [Methylobacter sp. G7]|uniref:hypothetical protein n=1 Tax=Methylobacter sp. G7 TaxID=3230117 RepID=UPI003D804CEF